MSSGRLPHFLPSQSNKKEGTGEDTNVLQVTNAPLADTHAPGTGGVCTAVNKHAGCVQSVTEKTNTCRPAETENTDDR